MSPINKEIDLWGQLLVDDEIMDMPKDPLNDIEVKHSRMDQGESFFKL